MLAGRTTAQPGDAERAPVAPSRLAQPHATQVLLSLQRTAGNQAVGRLLGTSAGPQRMLARFGVQVDVGDTKAVENVYVQGRPKERLIAGAEGSHVTAWAVFADIVRRKLVGLDVSAARTAARDLLSDQIAALKADWADPKPKAVADSLPNAQEVVDAIDAGGGAGVQVSQLQEAIAHYLRLHNLRRGTAVLIGEGKAIGAGEPRHLSALRLYESGGDQKPEALRTAMFGLLDTGALRFIRDLKAATPAAPGIDPAMADRVGTAVVRGLHDLAAAYPRSYQAAITQTHVEDWLDGKGLPKTLPGGLPAAASTPVAKAPVGWSRTDKDAIAAETAKRTAVCQIVLDPPAAGASAPATDAVVREVIVAGRPRTLFKSQQGHHAVAFKLEALRLEALRGQTLAEAVRTLKVFAEEAIEELDEAYGALEAEDQDILGFDTEQADYTGELISDNVSVLEAHANALDPAAADAGQLLLDAQEVAGDWMRAIAILPLATAPIGGPAGGKGEGKAIAVLKAYEKMIKDKKNPGVKRTAEARDNLVKLMDSGAVGHLYESDATGLGYPESPDERIGLILYQWLRAAKDSFPHAFADTGIGTVDGLRPVLDGLKLNVDDPKEVVQIALGLEDAPDWDEAVPDVEQGVWSGGEDEPKPKRGKKTKAKPKKPKTRRGRPVKA